ncbi:MAG: fimbrillin family protein [Bacteroidia bacterium]|nr:fimbrillin family protein [Bacteroidia bacterium]
MKKVLTTIAAVCAISGCAKFSASVPESEQNQPISFQAQNYVSSTKAGDADNGGHLEFTAESFWVRAVYTGAASWADAYLEDAVTYMNNVEVKKNNGVWAPAKDYYWPKAGKLTFIGWTPNVMVEFSTYQSSFLTLGPYTVKSDDLMLSDPAIDKSIEDADDITHFAPGVPMLFHHLLAKVNFKAKVKENMDSDGITHHIVLNSVIVRSIVHTGTYYVDATDSNLSGSWDAGIDYEDEDSNPDYYYTNNVDLQSIGSTYASVDSELTTTATDPLFPKDLYVMPQTLANSSIVELQYVIYYCNSKGKILDRYVITAATGQEDASQFKLKDFTKDGTPLTKWEQNKIYYYTIVFDPNSKKITFDPAVINWSSVNADPKEI